MESHPSSSDYRGRLHVKLTEGWILQKRGDETKLWRIHYIQHKRMNVAKKVRLEEILEMS